jgi:ComF family protein
LQPLGPHIYNGIMHNRDLLEKITGFIAPHRCLNCGMEGRLLCGWCLPDAVPAVPPRCYRCYAASEGSRTCKKCRRESRLTHVWVAGEYAGASKQLIHLFKFERAKGADESIAAIMEHALPYLPENVIITHVPAATSRVRKRGYDQSQLIAGALARRLNRRHCTLLMRRGQSRQVGAKRAERLRQLDGAFGVRNAALVKNAHILLVDDVVTTGATLEHAARALKLAGARSIDAAVCAQKL